tara:strand:+ start:4791 stop:4958 length:168 start_codon:yes stop_codon:yes gene_type:complete
MGYRELKAILDKNREELREEGMKRPVACPRCGQAPLDENSDGVLNCPIGDWRSSL